MGAEETVPSIVETLRANGAELVVAIIHGGLDDSTYEPALENQAWHLAQIAGMDAMLMGHPHQIFPNPNSTAPQFNLPGDDKVPGTVAGVPTVMANFWGKHLGVIHLALAPMTAARSVDSRLRHHGPGALDLRTPTRATWQRMPPWQPPFDTEHQATIPVREDADRRH